MTLPAQSDLILWLRADLGLFQDNPGTVAATADGDPVKVWTDQSGNGANATASTDAARPLLKLSILNGQPVLRADGSDDRMGWTGAGLWGSHSSYEGFIVIKKVVDSDEGGCWWFGSNDNSHYAYSDGNIYDGFFTNVRKTVGDPSPSLAAWRLFNCISASGEWTANLDGTQIFTTATNTPAALSGGGPEADGVLFSGHGVFKAMDIAEVFVYNRKLTTTERNNVGGYIQDRYGLTIAGATSPAASGKLIGSGGGLIGPGGLITRKGGIIT